MKTILINVQKYQSCQKQLREKNNVISELQKEVEKCTKDVEQTLKVSLSVHPIGLFAFACLFIHCWAIHSFIHPSISFNRILSYPIPFHPTPFHPILFHPILFHPILVYSCNRLPIHPYTCPPVRLIIYPIQVFIPSNYLSHPIIYPIQLFIPSNYLFHPSIRPTISRSLIHLHPLLGR